MRQPEMSADVKRDAFTRLVEAEAAALVELVGRRNRAYAGGDPLKCWRKRGLLGLLVRLEDKLNRFETFLEGLCYLHKYRLNQPWMLTDTAWNLRPALTMPAPLEAS